jgi:preprotein translocase subunit YajC
MNPLHIATTILAEGAPQTNPFGGPIPLMLLMVVMFYFLLIRPQQRQRKELAARIAALQTGDKVVTTAGIHGIVHNIKDTTVVVKVAEGTMIEFDKPAIATVQKKD